MEIYEGLLIIAAIYGILIFFDTFFKSCAHYPYIRFLDETGFEIKFLHLRWTTKAFNHFLIRWESSRSKFLHVWFTIGLYTSLAILPCSICLIIFAAFQNFVEAQPTDSIIIEPFIPGITVPLSELGYYSLTLVVCTIVHEGGHALAAVNEKIFFENVGVQLLYILPIAFVRIGSDKLFSLKHKKILKILCAGVWHNVVLSFIAFLFYLLLPYLFSTFFQINNGVTITNIAKSSPLLGPKGFNVGDVIVGVNDCIISNEESWINCFKLIHTRKSGFCLNSDLIHNYDESVPLKHLENGYLDCCDTNKPENYCFEYVDNDGILELPSHVCLGGRRVVESSEFYCSFEPHKCPNQLFCFRPLLGNYTNLFKILKNDGSNVIYSGPVSDVYRTIHISPYRTRYIFRSTQLPDTLTKFLKYVIIISMGLAIINILPCFYMDGQYITNILIQILLSPNCSEKKVKLVSFLINSLFTTILVLHCFYALWKMLF